MVPSTWQTTTASEHVRRLVRAGLVNEARQGRHYYLTLGGPQVAHAVEAMSLTSRTRPAASSLRGQQHDAELAAGRTCYRHLACRLGVELLSGWLDAGFVTDARELTDRGRDWFTNVGVDLRTDPRRALLRPCIDWTERRPHTSRPADSHSLRARMGHARQAPALGATHPHR